MISVYKRHRITGRQATRSSLWTEMEFKPTTPLVCAFNHGAALTDKRLGRLIFSVILHITYI